MLTATDGMQKVLRKHFHHHMLALAPNLDTREKDDKQLRVVNEKLAERSFRHVAGHLFQCDFKPFNDPNGKDQPDALHIPSPDDNDNDVNILPVQVHSNSGRSRDKQIRLFSREIAAAGSEERSAQVSVHVQVQQA
jgi:hypothetical protein